MLGTPLLQSLKTPLPLPIQTFSTELESTSTAVCFEEEMDGEMTRRLDRVEGILAALLQFCQRNSTKLEEKAGQVRLD